MYTTVVVFHLLLAHADYVSYELGQSMDLLSAVFNFLSPPSNFVRGHDSNVSDIVGVAPQCHTCIDCYRPGPRACSRCHMLEISILNGFETSKYLVELQCFRLLANDVLY